MVIYSTGGYYLIVDARLAANYSIILPPSHSSDVILSLNTPGSTGGVTQRRETHHVPK